MPGMPPTRTAAERDGDDATVVASRPAKTRKTQSQAQTQRSETAARELPVWNVAAASGDGAAEDATAATEDVVESEIRSCENCRRCKLKCSRSNPCNKCVLKGVTCLYEQTEKKRGPRPGYMEELYRRIDALEHMVLGQSLMLGRDAKPHAPLPATFQEAVDMERERLCGLGLNYFHQQQNQHLYQHSQRQLLHASSLQQQHSPISSTPSRDLLDGHRDAAHIDYDLGLSRDLLQQLTEVFRHQIHPWLPVVHQLDLSTKVAEHDPGRPLDPLLQAMVAAASPYLASVASYHPKYFGTLQEIGTQKILQSADLEHFRSSLILQFLLFGKGLITDFWGLVAYPPQLALRAGLHLEDHHLTSEHREFRQMVKFDDSDQSWTGKETMRRLFWALFLQDHFAAVLSGTRPSFEVTAIRRLLPCDGQRWHDDRPVHTHEFVPAAVAIQVQVFTDSNIGGLAYLIEATEIHAMVTAFVSRTCDPRTPKPDVRACLQEFLNLDLIMTNWKAKLPPRYQKASYDENGYMDHNITLAHLTHNTTGILLYQWPHAVCFIGAVGADLHSTLFPQIAVVKLAGKEIAKICTRFLLHRRYLVSPQFSYCQFTAARALLAYANWMMEPVDEDYETLYTSLAESAKRWDGVGAGHESNVDVAALNNFASMLYSRLAIDVKHPDLIDLATPTIHLLREMEGGGSPSYDAGSAYRKEGVPDSVDKWRQETAAAAAAKMDLAADTNRATATSTSGANMGVQPFIGTVNEFDRAMSLLVSAQSGGGLDTRIFSWHDSPELTAPTDPGSG